MRFLSKKSDDAPAGTVVHQHIGGHTETMQCLYPMNPFLDNQASFDYDLIAVISDGIHSFTADTERGRVAIPWGNVLPYLMDFKGYKGQFVKRRLRKFLADTAKLGWKHHDDISMAAIYLGE